MAQHLSDPDPLLDIAHRLAEAAARHTLAHFRTPHLLAEDKGGASFDPVTAADRAAEAAMRAVLAEMRPDDGIMGEETADLPGTSGLTWVLDPIDGTRAYISGLPVWGTLIALDRGAGPVLGLIDQPFTGERFVGSAGGAVLRRGGAATPLHTRACAELGQATLFSTFPEIGSAAERAAFQAVSSRCRLTRYGTDCYAYALLAMGQIDLVIEAGLNAYDIQAPIALVEAAGGIVTDWSGGPAHAGGRAIAAGDGAVHRVALEILRAHL
ncbi:MAG: histidinol-phosphatase [Pseudomonadota bacterium]